jgi:hypothetical protein
MLFRIGPILYYTYLAIPMEQQQLGDDPISIPLSKPPPSLQATHIATAPSTVEIGIWTPTGYTITHSSTTNLCAPCLGLHETSFFSLTHPSPPLPQSLISTSILSDIQNSRTTCPFCLFFKHTHVGPDPKACAPLVYKLEALSSRAVYGEFHLKNDATIFQVVPGVVTDGKWGHTGTVDTARSDRNFMRLLPSENHKISVRRIPEVVDFGLVKGWMEFCNTHHTKRCHIPESKPLRGFRLIDCATRSLVVWPLTECTPPYLTLSYVWGAQKAVAVEDADNLPVYLPRLIEDTMEVTTRLGYLWIDRYCVPQDDSEEKYEQIHNMDQIYARSAPTIIAVAGNGPDDGLPGLRNSRPKRQNYLKIGTTELLQTFPDPSDEILRSVWNTRGWTYQEGILAHRKLVFTSSQIYFQCPSMRCVEGLYYPLKDLHTDDLQRFRDDQIGSPRFRAYISRLAIAFPHQRVGQDAADPLDRIRDYHTKRLTFDTDAWDAFRGILNQFRVLETGALQGDICGVLLWPSDSCLESLIFGLRWIQNWKAPPYIQLERRSGLPSWSWLGWKFSPESEFSFGMGLTNYTFASRRLPAEADPEVIEKTEISIEYDDGQVIRWDEPGYPKAINMPPQCKPRLLRIRGFFATFDIPRIDGSNTAAENLTDGGSHIPAGEQQTSPPTPRSNKRAGRYLFSDKDVKRLRHLAVKTNSVAASDTYSFPCWVMQRLKGNQLPGVNTFAVMALSPRSDDPGSFERVDVFDIRYVPDESDRRLGGLPELLGWEMRDVVLY